LAALWVQNACVCHMLQFWSYLRSNFVEGTEIVTILPNWIVGQQIDSAVWMLLKKVLCLGGKK
jgi:hypothetical protein